MCSGNIVRSKILKMLLIKKKETYFVIFNKNTSNKNSSASWTKQNKVMLLSNCVVYGEKKSRFIKNQETSRLKFH